MHIYQGSTNNFIQDICENRLTDIMCNSFMLRFGKNPSESEKKSWQNSLPKIKEIIEIAELKDNYIVLEYEVPYHQTRVDCLIFGKDELGNENIVLLELKQWSEVIALAEEGNFEEINTVETYVGGENRIVSHPSQQAKGYQNYMKGFIVEFDRNPSLKLFSCAYCHN